MSKLLQQAEIVEVNVEDGKATLVFLDAEQGEIREVNFNKKAFDSGTKKWVDNEEKAAKVEGWISEYLGLTFDTVAQAVGQKHDVYCYEKFNSLFEVEQIAKFEEDMVGQILNVEVTGVVDDGNAIRIRFEYEGETYESKMTYSTFLEGKNEWFVNPQKRTTQYAKFEDKFGIKVADMQDLVSKTVMVEVKKAFGQYVIAEIKPFPKKKGKK